MTEAVVVAGDQRLGADLADQAAFDELATRQSGEGSVERDHDHAVDARNGEQRDLFVERREQPQPFAASERYARMGVERQYDALAARRTGLRHETLEQRPVAAVDAVVGADRDDRVPERRQGVETVEYLHLAVRARQPLPVVLFSSFSLTK